MVSPFIAGFYLQSLLVGKDRSVEDWSQCLALVPGRWGNLLRVAFYSSVLDSCDRSATLCFGVLVSKSGSRIGKHVYVGPYCQLGLVSIGDDTLLGPSVQIPSGPNTHGTERLDELIRNQPGTTVRVEIGNDCWIGASSVVMADVESHSVVGAGSVVNKRIPGSVLAAGIPAKVIRSR